MTDHKITLHVTPTGGENAAYEVEVPGPPSEPEQPKPKPTCCAETPIWWEEIGHNPPAHSVGWTGIENVAIQARIFWLYNPKFCPMCGTKLPDGPPR